MKPIADGIFWLPMDSVNVYLCVDENGELTLIDAAMPKYQDKILAAIRELGHSPQQLKRLVITHGDIDHMGSAAALASTLSLTIYAGPETANHLREGRNPKHMPWYADWIMQVFMRPTPVKQVTIFQDGDVLPLMGGFQAVGSPGHTLDHFSFYHSRTGVLFAGDALNTRQGRLQITPKGITADVAAAERSALRLLNLQPAIIACGHGQPLSRVQYNWTPLHHQLQNKA